MSIEQQQLVQPPPRDQHSSLLFGKLLSHEKKELHAFLNHLVKKYEQTHQAPPVVKDVKEFNLTSFLKNLEEDYERRRTRQLTPQVQIRSSSGLTSRDKKDLSRLLNKLNRNYDKEKSEKCRKSLIAQQEFLEKIGLEEVLKFLTSELL